MINFDSIEIEWYENDEDLQPNCQKNSSDLQEESKSFQDQYQPSLMLQSPKDSQINKNQQAEKEYYFDKSDSSSEQSINGDGQIIEENIFPVNDQASTLLGGVQQDQNNYRNIREQNILRVLQEENEKYETKNLPSYYNRVIRKYVKQEKPSKRLVKVKNYSISSLRELLYDEEVNKLAKSYFTSFQFLDDLLTSDKQQVIASPIKYLGQIYQECVKPNSLYNWKV